MNRTVSAESTGSHSTPSKSLAGIIDVHSHAILDFGTGREVGLGRPIESAPTWSIGRTLELMDTHGIDLCVLSVPNAGNIVDDPQARRIARQVNEWFADLLRDYPNRFGAVATIPALTIDGALEETAYALDVLHLDGIATTTSIDDVYLGDERFDPWFEEMNRRSATLFVHPVVPRAARTVSLGLNGSMLEFMFDTTRMLTNMVFSGAKQRFASIKIISAHAGGTLPYLLTRLQTTQQLFGPGSGRQKLSDSELESGFASFYYDLTAGTSPAQLTALQQLVPTSRLLMGFDNPFMPDWSIGPAIRDIGQWASFGADDRRRIARTNAEEIFPHIAQRLART